MASTTANEITTSSARLYVDGAGILIIRPFEKVAEHHTVEEAKENVRAMRTLCADRNRPALIDLRMVKFQGRDSRDVYMAPENNTMLTAKALIAGSAMSRAVANFFVALEAGRIPTKLFGSDDEALSWLKRYIVDARAPVSVMGRPRG